MLSSAVDSNKKLITYQFAVEVLSHLTVTPLRPLTCDIAFRLVEKFPCYVKFLNFQPEYLEKNAIVAKRATNLYMLLPLVALVKFYAFAILYVLIVMQIKLVVVVVD